jgi:hypothetical protein
MNCHQVREGQIAERYLLGDLTGAEREAYERHFLACENCFEEVRTLRAVRSELARRSAAPATGTGGGSRRWTWLLAAAAVVAAAAALVLLRRPAAPPPGAEPPASAGPASPGEPPAAGSLAVTPPAAGAPALAPPPRPTVESLSTVEPPAFTPPRLRGAIDEARRAFREAMKPYQRGDFAVALPGLARAHGIDPEALDIAFYLGATQLLTDRPGEATDTLGDVIAAGDTVFLEEALWLRAKAFLRLGQAAPARNDLTELRDLGGDRSQDASDLIARLDAIAPIEGTAPPATPP